MLRLRLTSVLLLIAGAGCFSGNKPPDQIPPPDDTGPTMAPPPVKMPPPAAGIYKRGSLQPVYQLTPREEYGRFTEAGVTMADSDFVNTTNSFVTATQKLDEIGAQIGRERGGAAIDLVPINEDRQRAQQVPFRGNPSDVKLISVNGKRKAYVPLGGDLMTPGNEVAAVDLGTGTVTRVKVGVHPQRIAVHPAGLIFVCNQFSNYITVIDPTTDQVLLNAKGPVEIKTEYYCDDLAFVPRSIAAPNVDQQDLYVANGWRASVLKYGLTVIRDGLSNRAIDVVVSEPAKPNPESQPAAEITGAGSNPYRLTLSQDQRSLYVVNFRGGEIARIELASKTVRRIAIKGPVPDIVQANDIVIVPTTTIDRGLLDRNDQMPAQVAAAPVVVAGLDGASHVAHPGQQLDNTKAYNFEDLRNGLLTIDAQLTTGASSVYYTDDISAEPNFVAAQKVLKGALPQSIVTNGARTRAFLAMSGSDVIQQISIAGGGAFRIADAGTPLIHTAHRPFAMAFDEGRNELVVADWGGEVLEVFDANNGSRKQRIDLGYATIAYPATNMEKGEFLFYSAGWSNNGRKACATCHFDELSVDGVPFANGATAPTEPHKVPGNWNLFTTGSYFWNGSFTNGMYASLAGDFQTRSNCELIFFGVAEGVASNPATRVGDPANRIRSGQDANCRPQTVAGSVLPANFDQVAQIIAAEHQVRDQLVQAATGLDFNSVVRLTDFYSASEMRLPPNPLTYLAAHNELDSGTASKITQGKQVFNTAGCGNCHDPNSARHPYTDGKNHGSGSTWASTFVNTYATDPRLLALLPNGIPQVMLQAIAPNQNQADREINIHVDPIDFFIPVCFDLNTCLVFEDPLTVRGNARAEGARLEALVKVNLANADRGFVPGNVRGSPQANTSSLRGIWFQNNFLRHGLAHSLKEAVLAPGHPLLGNGENGFAIDALGNKDVHGATSKLSAADFDALSLFIQSIE
jgi:hypothetical protein